MRIGNGAARGLLVGADGPRTRYWAGVAILVRRETGCRPVRPVADCSGIIRSEVEIVVRGIRRIGDERGLSRRGWPGQIRRCDRVPTSFVVEADNIVRASAIG